MMALDMTVQLAPLVWGMVGVLLASAVGILTLALPRTTRRAQATRRPTTALGHVALPASA